MVMERWRPGRGLIPWRPSREIEELGRHFEDIFGRPFLSSVLRRLPMEEKGWTPPIEVFEKELEVGGVFVEIGLTPNSEFIKQVVTLNHLGEIEVNYANETDVPGLFAAGDVTNVPEKQIVVAAGEGAKAALQAYRYLQRFSQ